MHEFTADMVYINILTMVASATNIHLKQYIMNFCTFSSILLFIVNLFVIDLHSKAQ